MPSKYSVKIFVEDGIYHVYNRGVEKRKIFEEDQDYKAFLHYLKRYLTDEDGEVRPRWKKDLSQNIQLLAYCLMPNHFHLLLKQLSKEYLTIFMRCVSNAYTRYFNEKYKRIGPLLQGKYKAVLVDKDLYLLHLTRYIHINPIGHKENITRSDLVMLTRYPYSSYNAYLGKWTTSWLHPEIALGFFKNNGNHSYENFVEEYLMEPNNLIEGYTIDEKD